MLHSKALSALMPIEKLRQNKTTWKCVETAHSIQLSFPFTTLYLSVSSFESVDACICVCVCVCVQLMQS